jgi:hypothetical protein
MLVQRHDESRIGPVLVEADPMDPDFRDAIMGYRVARTLR